MLSRVKTSNDPPTDSIAFGILQRELGTGVSAITVEGDLDLSTAPRLKWMLMDSLEAGHSRIVLDLSLATFMDSTALGVLVSFKRRLDEDARLAIVCTRPSVLKIFEFAGMDGVFGIFSTLDDAAEYAQGREARAS
jgi:anti-sigma B factor antagonist